MNIAENMIGTIRRVPRNVKRWRDAGMALGWVAAGMIEANKGFRRLKAHKQSSVLRVALHAHHDRMTIKPVAHVTLKSSAGRAVHLAPVKSAAGVKQS